LADLVAAYATLAADGRSVDLTFLKRGREASGAPEDERSGEFAGDAAPGPISPAAARSVLLWLSDPQSRAPSFPRLGALEYPWPVAVKTGTSQGYRDAWAVAVSRDYVVGMWMGDPDVAPMNGVAGNGVAAYVKWMMERLHPLQREGIDEELFPRPEGFEPVDLCVLSGGLAGPDCPTSAREWMSPDEAPRAVCPVHRRLAVDVATGALADDGTPPERLALRPFTVLSPEYALWGAKRGLGAPAQASLAAPAVTIVEPKDGSRFLLDPDTPQRFQTILLQARASAASAEVEWLVDGSSFASTGYPFAARLPLSLGDHFIVARSRAGGPPSAVVEIRVE
ncbi:MAG: hypothetical protein Q8M76_14965, partial [Spirochaetaceae bacterium]|nr:hypothetical protein [Spirochaetaceae bacterium]